MESVILKTLIYADIFDFPLTVFEIHKWLIGRKVTLRQVEKAVEKLVQSAKFKVQSGYFFLPGKNNLAEKRIRNKKYTEKYLQKAKMAANLLRVVSWIKLVGISGGLAMENVSRQDDIDLFVITEKNRFWLSRFLSILLLNIFRRKVSDSKKEVSGKVCLNLLLDTDNLVQESKDIYTAHEVLQMRVLWERDGVYRKFLSANEWVFKFLPNWITSTGLMIQDLRLRRKNRQSLILNHKSLLDRLENLTKWFQLKIMQKPKGMERVNNGALYFHPKDYRSNVMSEYKRGLDNWLVVE